MHGSVRGVSYDRWSGLISPYVAQAQMNLGSIGPLAEGFMSHILQFMVILIFKGAAGDISF